MRVREARAALADGLRQLLVRLPFPGAGAVRIERLLLRTRDALATLRVDGERVSLRVVRRHDSDAPIPEGATATSHLLMLPNEATAALPVAALPDPPGLSGALVERAWGDPRTLSLAVPGECEQACVFCRSPSAARRRPAPTGRLARWKARRPAERLTAALAGGRPDHLRVLFRGNDPLAFPLLPTLVERAVSLGYEGVGLLTPGARLGDRDTLESLVTAGLDVLEVPLYGTDPATHDALTRTPGGHRRLWRGLRAARTHDLHGIVHTALVRETLPQLGALATQCAEAGLCLERLEALVSDRGEESRYARLAPGLDTIRAALAAALPDLPRPLAVANVPDCLLQPPLPGLQVQRTSPSPNRVPEIHAPPCAQCTRRSTCPGVFETYVTVHGDGGLRPF